MKLTKRPALLEIRPADTIRILQPCAEDEQIGTGSLEFHDTETHGIYLVIFPPTDPGCAVARLTELAERATELRDAITAAFPATSR